MDLIKEENKTVVQTVRGATRSHKGLLCFRYLLLEPKDKETKRKTVLSVEL